MSSNLDNSDEFMTQQITHQIAGTLASTPLANAPLASTPLANPSQAEFNLKYLFCESKLSSEIQKTALALMFKNRYHHNIDYEKLLNELRNHNFFNDNSHLLCQILDFIFIKDSEKLIAHLLIGPFYTPLIDWEKLSKEKNVHPILIDYFGQQMNWTELVKNSIISPILIEKYSYLFYQAISHNMAQN